MALKYSQKAKLLRQHVIMIDGMPLVTKSWVLAYLNNTQVRRFKKKYGWIKRYNSKGKFRKYAYFWHLHTIVDGRFYAQSEIH